MVFVEDLDYKYEKKTHNCKVYKTANHVSDQGQSPSCSDDGMKTVSFGCVFIKELTEIMCPNTFISQPVSIIKYF